MLDNNKNVFRGTRQPFLGLGMSSETGREHLYFNNSVHYAR